jgi:hypothetical protein
MMHRARPVQEQHQAAFDAAIAEVERVRSSTMEDLDARKAGASITA